MCFFKLKVFLYGQFFCTFLQKLWQSSVVWCQSPGCHSTGYSAVSEEDDVLWCCLVCGPRKQYPTFCYHSPHLWGGWGGTSMHMEIEATECLFGGKKTSQRNGWVGGTLCIFLRSCYRGGTFSTTSSVFLRPPQHAIAMGTGRSEWLSHSALLLVWFPPEWCLWKTTSFWQ